MSGLFSRMFLYIIGGIALVFPGFAQAGPPGAEPGRGYMEMLMGGQTPPRHRYGAPAYRLPAQPGRYVEPSRLPAVYPQPGVYQSESRVLYQSPEAHLREAAPLAPPFAAPLPIDDPYAQRDVAPAPRGPQQDRAAAPAQADFDPKYEKQIVAYGGPHAPGTLIIDTPNRFLYLVQGYGRALRYGIGVGRPGFEWAGVKTVSLKREWPDWRPPREMLKRRPDLPTHMPGGPENPLGARALYLGSSLYRIHGTNEPETIGRAVSSGCIRMRNQDVVDLYTRVKVGTRVIVM